MSDDLIIYPRHTKDDTVIIIQETDDSNELKKYSISRPWQCEELVSSLNGRFIAIYSEFDFSYGSDKSAVRIGIISAPSFNLIWFDQLLKKNEYDCLVMSGVSVSEDGKYIAAFGANNDGWIQLIDVEKEKVLWEKLPYWSVNFNDACFSPDSNNVYVAGNTGLFCFDVLTGKILSQWQIDGRFISVAASPDGHLVAAGTTASGDVYVYESRTGKLLQLIKTGQYTVYGLTFSPDSKLLATGGVLNTNIKIWKMPDKNQQTK